MEDDPHPLLVAINESLRFRCEQSSRPLRVGKQLCYDGGNDCSADKIAVCRCGRIRRVIAAKPTHRTESPHTSMRLDASSKLVGAVVPTGRS